MIDELKTAGLWGSLLAGLVWLAKNYGLKLVDKWFEKDNEHEEKKEAFINQKISWLDSTIDKLEKSIHRNTDESMQLRMKMQSLEREIAEVRVAFKKDAEAQAKLVEVLKDFHKRMKAIESQNDVIGKVIMAGWPEKKSS